MCDLAINNKLRREPYPLNAFHKLTREASLEVLENMGAPDVFVGVMFAIGMTMSCQGLIDAKMPTGQVCPVQLNTLLVLESGERKTALSSQVLKPFVDADKLALEIYRKSLKAYKATMETWLAKKKGLNRALSTAISNGESTAAIEEQLLKHMELEPKKPRLRYFLRQDITAKAIMEALQGDGESIAISTDEGHVLFKSSAMSHFGLLNRLWDSPEVLPLDRSDHEHIMVKNPRVSVNIMTQSGPLKHYLSNRGSVAGGSGHWARYLVAYPPSTQGYRTVHQGELVWDHLERFHVRVRQLLDKYQTMIESGEIKREIVEFSEDAKSRWYQLATQVEGMLRPGEYFSDIRDFAAKFMEITSRLAATMHYFNGEDGKITLDTLERAFKLVEWHITEYKYMFSPEYVMPQDQLDAKNLVRWLRTRIWGGVYSDTVVPKNYVLQAGSVRNKNRLNAALDFLTSQGGVQIVRSMNPKDKTMYVRLMNGFFANIPA